MKMITTLRLLCITALLMISSLLAKAQMLISMDSVVGKPHPSSVLELSSNNKGFLLPRLTDLEMNRVKDPANGLLVYNKDAKSLYLFDASLKSWQPLVKQSANAVLALDSSEWVFDSTVNRVYLRRGLPLNDTVYYSTQARKFVFADKIGYNNSLGNPEFPFTDFTGKYYFKGTASRFTDESNLDPSMMNLFMEIDSTGMNSAFQGIQLVTVNNPKNMQPLQSMSALNSSTIHAGQDSAQSVNGISNAVTINGNGYATDVSGLSNAVRISSNSRNSVGTLTGLSNTLSRSGLSTGRVNGNVYGYFGAFSGFTNKVDGSMYGIYMNNVAGAAAGSNYSIFTNKGTHRFGDSVLVTDNFSTNPRAVFDINSNSAMILPAGSTAQQPLTGVAGMFRYNTSNTSPEYYNGSIWLTLGSGNGEWLFDGSTNRVNLVRGLPAHDTIFYNPISRKFVFSDRYTNTNSLGQDFPVDAFNGKYSFKGTASLRQDSAQSGGSVMNIVNEVDNDTTSGNLYNSLQSLTVMNPKAFQKAGQLSGFSNTTIHAGNDSVDAVYGILNTARSSGNGSSGSIIGISNVVRINNGVNNNTGDMIGVQTLLARNGATAGRVTGDVYGWQGNFSGFANKVDGKIFGIYLNPVTGAIAGKNFAFYSNAGTNRFGDSVLVTNTGAVNPRAVFDINATSAMIIPAGSTLQRPTTAVAGMFRYNNNLSLPEFYNGASWNSMNFDSSEWKFDPLTNRVNLVRGIPVNDTVFYNPGSRKFIFSDRYTNTNSLGQDFPVDAFNGKYTFKGTASQRMDSTQADGPVMNVAYEVDNASAGTVFNSLQATAVMNPKAYQRADQLAAITATTIHAGNDSVQAVVGILNATRNSGNGSSGSLTGILNSVRISNGVRDNTGDMIGVQTSMGRNGDVAGRVTGNVYGWLGTFSGLSNNVDGNIYGIYLNPVIGAAPKKNFAFYSNSGHNRFGDSVLVTDNGAIDPRAVFDINSSGAMIIPAGSTAQRPSAAVTGMFRYNSNSAAPEFFNGTVWKGLNSDSTEWKYDSLTKRVNLVRGLPAKDTVFYNPQTRKFVFSDRYTNTNSLGQDFPVDQFNAKYSFKGTASQRTDSTQLDGPVQNITYEVDNAAAGTVYNSLQTNAVMNPKALQKADQLSGISNTAIHAGNDSVQTVYGILNTARNSGNGKSGSITGIANFVRIQNGLNNNTGNMYGLQTTLSRSGTTAGRVTGNAYGWYGSFSGFTNFIDGNIYGVYLNSVTGAATKKNFAFYSNKGLNRLGDSLLITDGVATNPRAILDINTTGAFIEPVGTTAQRPAAPVQGMVRFNNTTGNDETYNGTKWAGIIRLAININLPVIAANLGYTASIALPGATTGSAVSVSPDNALPNGLIIAYARVSAANTVEIRFENNATSSVNPAAQNFNIRVIQ